MCVGWVGGGGGVLRKRVCIITWRDNGSISIALSWDSNFMFRTAPILIRQAAVGSKDTEEDTSRVERGANSLAM